MLVGIVAGEASGDILAAGLMKEFRKLHPEAEFVGVCGPRMLSAGATSLEPMDSLAVFGIVEIFKDLPRLLRLRNRIKKYFLANKPDVFIGVDAPEFNLGLEKRLRAKGVTTVHYVSPSVWAWRQSRIKGIKQSVELMLTFLPFEAAFYREHDVPVKFVGHPLADELYGQGSEAHRQAARNLLRLPQDAQVVSILPGSRSGEIKYLLREFLVTAAWLHTNRPGVRFVIPAANEKLKTQIENLIAEQFSSLPILVIPAHSREAMQAADAILLASGTAALEAMLLGRPMVVGYKLSDFTYKSLTKLNIMKIQRFSLPNLLADKELVPEFIQDQLKAEKMGEKLAEYLDSPNQNAELLQTFAELGEPLRANADKEAAQAVYELLR